MNLSSTEAWHFCEAIATHIEENFGDLERFISKDWLEDWAESYYYKVFSNSGDLETYMEITYKPEDVFEYDALARWARANGFVEE